jgi:hypothetical protein
MPQQHFLPLYCFPAIIQFILLLFFSFATAMAFIPLKIQIGKKVPEAELQRRGEQLSLALKHIEECEFLEKRRYTQQRPAATPQRAELFAKCALVCVCVCAWHSERVMSHFSPIDFIFFWDS